MSDKTTKLVIGRVVELNTGKTVIVPVGETHNETTLLYQKHLAALIEAAYQYENEHSPESLQQLIHAAEAM